MPRIVVVDDETMIRDVLVRRLALWGYPEAIGVVPEGSAGRTTQLVLDAEPDIVVSDHDLKLNFTGVDVVERLRLEGFKGKIIVFSSLPTEAQRALFGPYEIAAYVIKPDLEGLKESLARVAK